MIALVIHENLGFVLQPAEGRAVDDPVAVALEHRARRAVRLGDQPPAAFCGFGGIRLKVTVRLAPC